MITDFEEQLDTGYSVQQHGRMPQPNHYKMLKHLAISVAHSHKWQIYQKLGIPRRVPNQVVDEFRMIYFSVPKVASSSMRTLMSHLRHDPVGVRPSAVVQRATISELRAGRYDSYWKFAIVRNPWSRLVSSYLEKIRVCSSYKFSNGVSNSLRRHNRPWKTYFWRTMSFSDYVHSLMEIPDDLIDDHVRSQWSILSAGSGELFLNEVIPLENFSVRIRELFDRLGAPLGDIPHVNKVVSYDYRTFYDAHLWDLVGHRYAKDIALGGYESEG